MEKRTRLQLSFNYRDFFRDGEVYITPELYRDMKVLVSIVLNKHFRYAFVYDESNIYIPGAYEEFEAVAISKMISMLEAGDYDEGRMPLFNYFYMYVRGEIKNLISVRSNEIALGVPEDFFDTDDQYYFSDSEASLDLSSLDGLCSKFEVARDRVLDYIRCLVGVGSTYCGSLSKSEEKVVCLILWEGLES